MSDLFPPVVGIPLAVVLGALIGSFLNVVIWRVPRGESIVSPGSACPGCGAEIAWYDNIPILSWLMLRARCRHCNEPISARYPAVEGCTAAAFGVVVWGAYAGSYPSAVLPVLLYWAAVAIALALIDVDHHRLPDAIVLPSYVVTVALLILASVLTGDYARLVAALIGGIALGGFYLALALLRPGGMGLGDVKLAGALGMLVAWLGWAELLVGAFAAFLIGGLVGVALMAGSRATRKTALPFGPFMLLGAALGIWAGRPLADLYLTATGLA